MMRADLTDWRIYGFAPQERYCLMRHKRNRHARYLDRHTGEWFGPEQSNVAPAVAWGLAHGIEGVATDVP